MIIFENKGEIDIRAISTFGVSAKETDNPIGFFGTGLKYAIAVLLRTGQRVMVQAGADTYFFDVSKETMRGKEFSFVVMTDGMNRPVPIGFTTDLGKQWKLWMAYRELACNCLDEKGRILRASEPPEPEAGVTRFIVSGDDFDAVYAERGRYILEDPAGLVCDSVEVRKRRSGAIYYRGVRVFEPAHQPMHTYNVTAKLDLTEDRTIKSEWDVKAKIVLSLLRCHDQKFLEGVVTAPQETFEHHLDWHGWGVSPSAEFLQAVHDASMIKRVKVSETAMRVWRENTRQKFEPDEIELTVVQRKTIERALDFCGRIGFPIRGAYPIKVVETLGAGGLGLAEDNTIFLAERVFHLGGTKQVASALIEEYLHLRHGYADMSRELQSYLFEKLVSMGEELIGEPL